MMSVVNKWGYSDPALMPEWLQDQAAQIAEYGARNLRIGEILVTRNLIDEAGVEKLLSEKPPHIHFGEYVINNRSIPQRLRDAVPSAIAASSTYQLPFFYHLDSAGFTIQPELFKDLKLQREVEDLNAILMKCSQTQATFLVFADFGKYETWQQRSPSAVLNSQITSLFKSPILAMTTQDVVSIGIRLFQDGTQAVASDTFSIHESEMLRSAESHQEMLAQMLNTIMNNGGSDLHITPLIKTDKVLIEARYNTKLKKLPPALQIDKTTYHLLRDFLVLKTQATPQNSAIFIPVDGNAIDYHRKNGEKVRLRTSFMPLGLESSIDKVLVRIVIRIMPLDADIKQITDLGFSQQAEALLYDVARTKGKMTVMVAPMGSGKTTTMYAVLSEIRDYYSGTQAILSLEDPIEQIIDGIHQIQLSSQARKDGKGYDYYLKNFKRQDSNILYLGEIRDKDTAENAAQFASVGNKLITTMHASDEMEGVQRLMTMVRRKDDQMLLINSLSHIFSQRIIPILCNHCKVEKSLTGADRARIESIATCKLHYDADIINEKLPLSYFAPGTHSCSYCSDERYTGVKPVLSALVITADVRRSLTRDRVDYEQLASRRTMTMTSQIIQMVIDGLTPIDSLDI
jgi:type II secretory ATPase GspE/PulE/Tfp pilus assembly ATPase PilB-like protein